MREPATGPTARMASQPACGEGREAEQKPTTWGDWGVAPTTWAKARLSPVHALVDDVLLHELGGRAEVALVQRLEEVAYRLS